MYCSCFLFQKLLNNSLNTTKLKNQRPSFNLSISMTPQHPSHIPTDKSAPLKKLTSRTYCLSPDADAPDWHANRWWTKWTHWWAILITFSYALLELSSMTWRRSCNMSNVKAARVKCPMQKGLSSYLRHIIRRSWKKHVPCKKSWF